MSDVVNKCLDIATKLSYGEIRMEVGAKAILDLVHAERHDASLGMASALMNSGASAAFKNALADVAKMNTAGDA